MGKCINTFSITAIVVNLLCSHARAALWTSCRSSVCGEICGIDGNGGIQLDIDAP